MNLEYLTDASGNQHAVVVPIADWKRLMAKMSYYESASKGCNEITCPHSGKNLDSKSQGVKNSLHGPAIIWDEKNIPDNEKWLHTPENKAKLESALAWAAANPPTGENTDSILARLAANC